MKMLKIMLGTIFFFGLINPGSTNLLIKKDGSTIININNSGDIEFSGYYKEKQTYGSTSGELIINELNNPKMWTTDQDTRLNGRMFFKAKFPNQGLKIKNSGVLFAEIGNTGNMYIKGDQLGILSDPKDNGPFSFDTKIYASANGIQIIGRYLTPSENYGISRRLDISDFYNLIDDRWEFNTTDVPINGVIKIPMGSGKFPLAIFIHGKHYPFDYSEEGYIYLCELLATHGIIAATIDANFLNLVGHQLGEFDARAILPLEHIKEFKKWNETQGHPLYNKVNMEKILLIGHSRGGEGAAMASYFNKLDEFETEEGVIVHFDGPYDDIGPYHFSSNRINVCALAPTDYYHYPPDVDPIVVNDNLLMLQGSQDGDVLEFPGFKSYDRAHPIDLQNPVDPADGYKSLLYIYGANHNYFNQDWDPEPMGNPTVTRAQQEDIAKVYVNSMVQGQLLDRSRYLNVLKDYQFALNWLPTDVDIKYVSEYQDNERLFINHYEEDTDKSTVSPPVQGNNSWNLDQCNELYFQVYMDPAFHLFQETNGLEISYNNSSHFYTISFPGGLNTNTYQFIALRVGQSYNNEKDNHNFHILIEDAFSNIASFEAADIAPLYYPDNEVGSREKRTVMQTLRIPLSSVSAQGVDLHNISSIKFHFDIIQEGGYLYFDEIQLSN